MAERTQDTEESQRSFDCFDLGCPEAAQQHEQQASIAEGKGLLEVAQPSGTGSGGRPVEEEDLEETSLVADTFILQKKPLTICEGEVCEYSTYMAMADRVARSLTKVYVIPANMANLVSDIKSSPIASAKGALAGIFTAP